MPESNPESSPLGLNVSDIAYMLFRHKWTILLGCGLGIAAAMGGVRVEPGDIPITREIAGPIRDGAKSP